MKRRIIGACAVGLSVCLLAGCASENRVRAVQPAVGQTGAGAESSSPQLPLRGALRCPSHAPSAMSLDVARPFIVRPGAVSLELCRYSGRNAPRPLHLSRSRRIRDVALVGRLTRELNKVPERRGLYNCPMDDGSEIVLLFGYRDLRPQRVIVGLRGCHFITNGWTDRLGTSRQAARLVAQLTALTRRGSSRAG